MRPKNSVFVSLLEPIDRRWFKSLVERHDADAYDKSFSSWDHVVALIFAQLSRASSLRALETAFNANASGHYHLGVAPLKRSTLSDANARRPVAVYAELFTQLSQRLDRKTKREGDDMLRLIDSSPIPLARIHEFARSNGRIHGLKLHVVHDPRADRPVSVDITPANVNDVEIGKKTRIEAGSTYVFDKGYCDYSWWTRIAQSEAFFVTRPKKNARFATLATRPLQAAQGESFTVLEDREVELSSRNCSKLPMRLRLVTIERDAQAGVKSRQITVITNDMARTAVEIAALYKARWAIELLFRWIKQHLSIRKFLGRNENAVWLQVLAAMIAFVLLRIAAAAQRALPHLRFAELVGQFLFDRRRIEAIDKPPPKKPPPSLWSLDQFAFQWR